MKKVYESKKTYSDKYNKSHKSIRIKIDLYNELKSYIKDDITIKDFIEKLIKNHIHR